jgi:capsular polysaccharide biosynthesis protein
MSFARLGFVLGHAAQRGERGDHGDAKDEGTTLDFWDLTKVLFRRWRIALPIFLLAGGLTVLTFSMVKPDYVATSYVQLVPPLPQQTKPGQPEPPQRNPWLSQGLQTLGNAAIVTLTDKFVLDHMKSTGMSDSYTAEMGSSSPLVKIEVVGKSRAQAEGTANELVDLFNQNVASLQTAYGVTTVDLITTRRLDLGKNVEKSDANVKRALVAVFGAGLLLMVGVTIGFDAWHRRRNWPQPASPEMESSADRAIGMATAGYGHPGPAVGYRPMAITRTAAQTRARSREDADWPSRPSVVYQTARISEPEDIDTEVGDDSTIIIPNFVPKNGAEIIPPPSEWLVNDRDGNA